MGWQKEVLALPRLARFHRPRCEISVIVHDFFSYQVRGGLPSCIMAMAVKRGRVADDTAAGWNGKLDLSNASLRVHGNPLYRLDVVDGTA